MTVDMKRIKTQGVNPNTDDMVHFVHKDDVLECNMFLLFFYLVTNPIKTTAESAIFPNWDNVVLRSKEKGTDSKVSAEFRKFWKKMFSLCEDYCIQKDEINQEINFDELMDILEKYCLTEMSENQSSHGGKKRGVQDIADGDLKPQVRIFKIFHA